MNVLIAEDNANDRKLLHYMLEHHGCTVIEAQNGLEALELARRKRPDLIISDALMPRIDGFQFLRALKADPELSAIPFLFYSAVYTGEAEEKLAFSLGATAFVVKPAEPEELWKRICAIMESWEAQLDMVAHPLINDSEEQFLREYGRIVATKLEEKVLELEENLARRRETEEELLKLSAAIMQCPVSIVITDTQGNIEFVNPKFSQITGYSAEEARGNTPRILKTGETSPEEYARLWATISAGNVWQGEFHNRKKTGELFWEYATISPLKNQQGVITHYIAIKEDISERRDLENQLRQAQKIEAIGTLAGGVAHDFNNILTVIIGFGNILEMKMPPNDPLLDDVKQILAAAERAAILTRSMLAFSRKQVIAVKPENLNEIVIGMQKMLHRLIREDIELRIRLANDVLTSMTDAGQLGQVLLNLATNARDSMPSGGVITITTEQAELDEAFVRAHGYGEPGRYALITFTDSGEGMEESVQQRIFEPFFTTKETGKGTGLGLSVCYGIIKQHNGYIVCSSEPGKGTSFRIYLPLIQSSAEHEAAAPVIPPRGGAETILVAEDDANVRSLVSSILTEFGYKIIEAQDGEEAVTRFIERPDEIQLCLFDVIMPKKNGLDACQEIRKMRSGIRVLFMSGYQADISKQDGPLKDGLDLIMKPLVPRELLKRVREMLER